MKRLAILILTFALPLSAAEKWYDWYNRGVAAVRADNYKEAADALQRAVAEMPNESTSARAGNVIITYVPHFWLGIARYNLGEVDAALREWKTSEEQGAVQNTQYYAQLHEWVARAGTQKQRNSETAATESRKAADAAMSRALAGQMDALAAGADRSDSYRAAQRKLQEALEAFNKAGTDIRAYRHASDLAAQAREMFVASAEESKKAKAAHPVIVQKTPPPKPQPREFVVPFDPLPVTQTTPATQTTAPSPAPKTEPPKPKPVAPVVPPAPAPVESEAVVSARIAIQAYKRHLLDAKQPARDAQALERRLAANASDAGQVKLDVEKGEKALAAKRNPEPPPMPVPAPVSPLPVSPAPIHPAASAGLVAAYRAFAGGDLAHAEALLTQLVATNPDANAYLLRGCTRWTRATLTRADVRAAADDFRTALRMNRSLRLDPAAFSPKLVDFFEQVRRSL